MPLYNKLRAIKCKKGYEIEYFGGWIKRWKKLNKNQYGDPSIYGFDVLPMAVILSKKEDADEYVKSRVTMMDIESVSIEVLRSYRQIRLVRYTANDGVFYHVEELEGFLREKWLTAKAWRLTHEENNYVDKKNKVLANANMYIDKILRYEYKRAQVNESMPC